MSAGSGDYVGDPVHTEVTLYVLRRTGGHKVDEVAQRPNCGLVVDPLGLDATLQLTGSIKEAVELM
jgi:hypothetical protein